eukprot:gene15887-biopygen10559
MGGHMGILGGLVEILRGRRGVRRDHFGVPSDEEVLPGAASAHWGAGASSGITVGFRATRRFCPELRQPTVFACISLLLAAPGGRRLMGNPSAPFSATNGIKGGHMGAFGGLVEILRDRRGVRRDHGGVPSDEEVLPGAASAHRICLYFLASGSPGRQEAHGESKRALLGHQWGHG